MLLSPTESTARQTASGHYSVSQKFTDVHVRSEMCLEAPLASRRVADLTLTAAMLDRLLAAVWSSPSTGRATYSATTPPQPQPQPTNPSTDVPLLFLVRTMSPRSRAEPSTELTRSISCDAQCAFPRRGNNSKIELFWSSMQIELPCRISAARTTQPRRKRALQGRAR